MEASHNGVKFSDADVVNGGNFIPKGEYNPHNVRPWLLHDHGFAVAVVFADCEGDAIDEAVDGGKLDRFQLDPSNASHRADYGNGKDGDEFDWNDSVSYHGNAGEPFDLESLGMMELPNVPFSFAAMFAASQG
jgi:hypothetical protein